MRISSKSVRLLNNLFNIRPTEWPRFSLIYLMYFVAVIGKKWGEPVIEAAFLEQVGVDFLPWAFLINAIFTIIAIAIYTAFADRVSNRKLLIGLFLVSAAGIAAGLGLLGWGLVVITYPLLYLILNVPLLDIFNVHWPTYVNSFYNTQSAKRIIPLLASSTRIAGIAAALTLPLLNSFLSPVAIIVIFLGTLVLAAGIAWVMPYLLKEETQEGQAASPVQSRASYIENIREGFRYISDSPFLRWLALASLMLFILLPFINYQALQIFKNELQTTERISNFIVVLNGIGDLLALPVQLFLLNRLIGRVGLPNTSLIFPGGMLAIGGVLAFFQGLPAAALGYFSRTTFRTTLRNPVDSLLYNAVPLRVKGRARAFIGGLVVPVGSIIGGLLLLSPAVSTAWFLPLLTGLLALAFLGTSLIVRREYSRAFITMLEQEDFSFLLSQTDNPVIAADPATLKFLQNKLEQSQSPEFTIFMAQLISQIGTNEALSILGQTLRQSEDSRLRTALLQTITAAESRSPAAYRLYAEFLADPDPEVRQAVIAGLEQAAGPGDEDYISQLTELLVDPETEVRVRALAGLVRSGRFYELPPAIQLLSRLLADPDPHQRAYGVATLGLLAQIGDEQAIPRLVDYLSDPADEVRLEAVTTLEGLAPQILAGRTPLLLEKVRPLRQDPVERIRQAVLNVLGNLGQPESYEAIVQALTDPSPAVRATAADVLARLGKAAIPIVHPQLEASDPQLRKMVAVILSRINRREFGHLIKTHITNNLLLIYRNVGRMQALATCYRCSSLTVLQSALQEENKELLDEIFYLLAAVHDESSLRVVTDSLASDDSRTRANATEALESLTTPQTASLIVPLFDPDPNLNQLAGFSLETWEMQPPTPEQAIEHIMTDPDEPWLRAIMTFALGEMGLLLQQSGQSKKAPGAPGLDPLAALADLGSSPAKPKPQGRRTPPADLLGALIEDDAAVEEPGRTAGTGEAGQVPFTLPQIKTMLATALADPAPQVRQAAEAASRLLVGGRTIEAEKAEVTMLSNIEKIIFLKEVPFFAGMTIRQLQALADVCEEELYEEDETIFNQNDSGGALYVIVNGRVGIEQEKRKGTYARLATLETHSYFGEMTLLDNGPRSASAIALQDTLLLRLRREPLIALARQFPDLSLELIKVLSERLRQANNRIAELTRSHPRQLQKLFDELD